MAGPFLGVSRKVSSPVGHDRVLRKVAVIAGMSIVIFPGPTHTQGEGIIQRHRYQIRDHSRVCLLQCPAHDAKDAELKDKSGICIGPGVIAIKLSYTFIVGDEGKYTD